MILKTSPKKAAFLDMTKWFIMEGIKMVDANHDVWNVGSASLDTKEQRGLNKKLGVHRVNMHGGKS